MRPPISISDPNFDTYMNDLWKHISFMDRSSRFVAASPYEYGAKGDWNGTTGTDDTNAINNAIVDINSKGGGKLHFYGRFKITSAIILKPKVDLIGISGSRLAAWGANTPAQSEIYNAGTGYAINISDSTGYRNVIKDLFITGTASSSHGIYIANVYDGEISNCVLSTHGGDGINSTAAASWKIKDNLFYNNTYGLRTGADTNGWDISGNHFQANKSYGIYGDSWWGCSFTGNTVEGNVDREMYLRTLYSCLIGGNYFEGSIGTAIYLDNYSKSVEITSNFFNGYTSQAIFFTDGTYEINDFIIKGNSFRSCASGVHFGSSSVASNCEFGPNFFSQIGSVSDRMTNTRYNIAGTLNNSIIYDDQASKWMPSTKYFVGNTVTNDGGKVYVCDTEGTSAASGGPTGVTNDIVDNTTRWDYQAYHQYTPKYYGMMANVGGRAIKSFSSGSYLDYVIERGAGQTLADDGEQDTEMKEQGFFFFSSNDSEYAMGYILQNGTVTLLHNSANVGTTEDNDTTWNIFRDATTTTIHVQNKRGSTKNYMFYSLNAFY